jgi:hypothetical protein
MRTATRMAAAAVVVSFAAACGPREDTTWDDTAPGTAPAPQMQPAPPPPPATAPGTLPGDTLLMDTLGAPATGAPPETTGS